MAYPLYDRLFGRHAGSDRSFLHLNDGAELSYGEFVAEAGRFAAGLSRLCPIDELYAYELGPPCRRAGPLL